MSDAEFTPGPWRWDGTELMAGEDSRSVVLTANPLKTDAHLIAAAPELFQALEIVRDADEDCKRDGLPAIPALVRSQIDAALARARGESS